MKKRVEVPEEIAAIILKMEFSEDGKQGKLTQQLDRQTYTKVNKALELLGGKWNRKLACHLFEFDPRLELEKAADDGVLVVDNMDFYETPDYVIDMMLSLVHGVPQTVLEPSAGNGAILKKLSEAGYRHLTAVELNPARAALLRTQGYAVHERDFLQHRGHYDLVMMNPPFSGYATSKHILHACSMSNQIIAIADAGVMFRQFENDKLVRDKITQVIELPENTFAGTGVKTVLIKIFKEPRFGYWKTEYGQRVFKEVPGQHNIFGGIDGGKDRGIRNKIIEVPKGD